MGLPAEDLRLTKLQGGLAVQAPGQWHWTSWTVQSSGSSVLSLKQTLDPRNKCPRQLVSLHIEMANNLLTSVYLLKPKGVTAPSFHTMG